MSDLIQLLRQTYSTYKGDREPHALRVTLQFIVALMVGVFGVGISGLPLSVMSLAISVLTGFSFTALFSEPSTRMSDLPAPLNESDRMDLKNLRILSYNFRIRAKYFILLAVVELLLMVLLVTQVDIPRPMVENILPHKTIQVVSSALNELRSIAYRLVVALIVAIFLEWVHTFYRLSETILAILKTRADYMEARHVDN